MNFLNRVNLLSAGLLCLAAFSSFAFGNDRFSLAVGVHDKLVIFGAKGERVAELSVPTIAQTATASGASFQISYGRDANNRLTAIIAPTASGAPPLHFLVLGKAVDADQAVVTLTFSSNLRSVIIDPGYAGTVDVDSHRLREHRLSDDVPTRQLYIPGQIPASLVATAPAIQPSAPVASNSAVSTDATPAPAPISTASTADTTASTQPTKPGALASNVPQPIVGQMAPPILGNDAAASAQVASTAAPASAVAPEVTTSVAPDGTTTKTVKLYWSLPVTSPDGTAPPCGVDEIRLVEVFGSVSVIFPNGETKSGVDGLVIPSGSKVLTMANSSTALFLGGVNSARLMPNCDLTVTQTLDGTTRKDRLDLEQGAVFARVGQRDGEVEDYTIHTPEGVTSGDSANFLAFRGTMDDLPPVRSVFNMGRLINPHRLFAWNPSSFGHNLISDTIDPVLAANSSSSSTTFFYGNSNTLSVGQVQSQTLATSKSNGEATNADNPNTILQNILTTLLPFNAKLQPLLNAINSGTANKYELNFYHGLLTVFFTSQVPSIASTVKNLPTSQQKQAEITQARYELLHDLVPFAVPAATPSGLPTEE